MIRELDYSLQVGPHCLYADIDMKHADGVGKRQVAKCCHRLTFGQIETVKRAVNLHLHCYSVLEGGNTIVTANHPGADFPAPAPARAVDNRI